MSIIENRIIRFNDHIDTYSYSGTIGDHLVELGLPTFTELSVEFVEDETGEVNIIDVRDEETDQNMWEPEILDDKDWSDTDDEILEALISWYENNL